jgi:hypothetical protein
MYSMKKKVSSYRLSNNAKRLLALLSMQDGISHTAELELAIRERARRKRVLDTPKEGNYHDDK